jgi:MYXO-CTERM domain-containing protein
MNQEGSIVHRPLRLLAPLVVPIALGCGSSDGAGDRLGEAIARSPAAIEGGYKDTGDTHVVGVARLSDAGAGTCSGTLIAPNVVLTARHCVAPTSSGGGVQCGVTVFGNVYAAEQFYITTNAEFTYDPEDYFRAAEVHVPPDGNQFCGRDQALIILTASIPAEIAAPSTPRVDTALVAGDEYYAVGFGQIYDGGPSGTRYRRDELETECVGADCGFPGSIFDTEWLGETAVCQGDSGGPAFDLYHRVVGVASRGSSGCETPIYGHVFGWSQWIKDVTVYAAGLAGEEPPPWATGYPTDPAYSQPVGADCQQPSDCPSGLCLDSYCTRPCNLDAPCPDGYECRSDGFCEEVVPPPPPATTDPDDDSATVAGCALSDADPTKPIPWKLAAPALALLWLSRRRRQR